VGELPDQVGRDTRLALGVLEGVRLDPLVVRLDPGRRARDELAVPEPGGEDLTPDRVGERDVRADVEAQPAVGPLRRARPARVDGIESRPVVNTTQEVVEEDRMRLARVRSPQDDEVGLLDLLV
jgi:hypothetical protein